MPQKRLITISSDHLVAEVSTIGAELHSLADNKGRQLIWDGDPAFWTGRAPILFPIIGLLEHGRYRLGEQFYKLPKHGFARHSVFELVERQPDAATFRLCASDATRAAYPFKFVLDVRFSLKSAQLTVAATISNASDAAMPASFGFHPAFRWPLPFGQPRSDHRISFEHQETAPVRRINAEGLLLTEPQKTPIGGNSLKLRDALFLDDALIFDHLKSSRLNYGAGTGPQIEVDFADFPVLGVWTKPDAEFVCIEPWQGLPDPAGYSGDIFDKPGIISIAPGGSKRLAMTISVLDKVTQAEF